MKMLKYKNGLLFLVMVFGLCGCDIGLQQMGATEVGIIFRRLPPSFGGGLSKSIAKSGENVFIWPWDSLYRLDLAVKYVSWGANKTDTTSSFDYVYTRALDGNEVALGVTVQYRLNTDPEKLLYLLRHVATSNTGVDQIIQTVARADIRTFMNQLKTSEFFNRDARYKAIEDVKKAMNERLATEGISIESVILDEHRFVRLLPDGNLDDSYQEKIDETQKFGQDTERELLRIETVKAQKEQDFNNAQAAFNRQVAEAEGYLDQAKLRADSYFKTRGNVAKGITAKGMAEVEGMKAQIAALAGEGGRAMLRLELSKELLKGDPKFVIMQESGQTGLSVNRTDVNQLLKQIGVFEGLQVEKTESKKQESSQ